MPFSDRTPVVDAGPAERVGADADAFIAANFPVPLSAKLAFLVFGPMMDVKLVFMYLSVYRGRFVAGLALSLFVVIGALCYFWMRVL